MPQVGYPQKVTGASQTELVSHCAPWLRLDRSFPEPSLLCLSLQLVHQPSMIVFCAGAGQTRRILRRGIVEGDIGETKRASLFFG